jgi:signal peptidase II
VTLRDPRLRTAAPVAAAVLLADQATKAVVAATMRLHESIPLTSFLALAYERNTGAAFSVLAGAPPGLRTSLFVTVTLVALGVLASWLARAPADRPALAAAIGAIMGGAAGNLICRLRFGEVIDFIDLHWGALHWPVFNVADSAITVGVAVVLLTARGAPTASR